jgi:hypothetical protein
MLWLAKDDNRHIVSGAAGSASTGGNHFAGTKKVVPKIQGFTMLAALVNKDHPGSGWTADIASKKYLYLHGKYSAAKTASYRSDWGLSQTELNKGISLEDKLEGLCKDFEAWDKWFGQTQKYNPANIQDSSTAVSAAANPVVVDSGSEDSDPSSSDESAEDEKSPPYSPGGQGVREEVGRSGLHRHDSAERAALSTMKLRFEMESAEQDRVARAAIQTETNITSLLNVDPTGTSARLMMELVTEGRRRAAAFADSPNHSSVQRDVDAFALQLAAPATLPIVIHSSASQNHRD